MFLGIDIGNSGVKSTIVNLSGDILTYSYRAITVKKLRDNRREIDPLEVREKTFETIKEVLGQCREVRIKLITISGFGEALVPVDCHGNILMNTIAGSDPRGTDELAWLKGQISIEELVDITKLNLCSIYSLNKILYIKNNHPEIHEKVWKYLCYTDYMGYLLTGETKIDYSMASRTMIFDINQRDWSKKMLNLADIDRNILSTPVPGGTIIGNVLSSVKKELNITYDIPVMVGSHDHIYNAIGVGAVKQGICSNAVGTTEGITTILESIMPSETIIKNNISCEPYVVSDIYNTVAWHNTAGAMVNWFLDTFYSDVDKSKGEILDYLNSSLDDTPSPLVVHPHFAGSTVRDMDGKAKGSILGLTLTTGKEDIYKAILEGATFECKMIIDSLMEANIPVEKIIVSGGGSRSLLWLQIKANIFGLPIYKSEYADSGPIGGALLGSVVLGYYDSLEEAANYMVKPGTLIVPNHKYDKVYEERYQEYQKLYNKLKIVNHIL